MSSSPLLGNLTGSAKIWFVGGMFAIAGFAISMVLPELIFQKPAPETIMVEGEITGFEEDPQDPSMKAEMFAFQTREGENVEVTSGAWSNLQLYKIGESVEIYYNPSEPEKAWIKDDKTTGFIMVLLYIAGGVFAAIGLAIIVMKLRGMEDRSIETIAGGIGALAYAIPAIFVLPGLYYLYLTKPNLLYSEEMTTFPEDHLLLGLIFTSTGVVAFLVTVLLYRYQKRNDRPGLTISKEINL